MNAPNYFGRISVDAKNSAKSFLYGFLCLFVFNIVSINDVVAQSPAELGEEVTELMLDRFSKENQFLEDESTNLTTVVEINQALMEAYEQGVRGFRNGEDLSQVISLIVYSLELDSVPNADSLFEELEGLGKIESLDELNNAFLIIRNLKNQLQ